MSDLHIIWWVEDECEESPEWTAGTPEYIRDEYSDRIGRAGRGRLWCADGMPEGIDVEWPKNDLGKRLACRFAGIVINKSDFEFVKNRPGQFTNFLMQEV